MKLLLLLSFFSFALCTLQEENTEKAFHAYSCIDTSLPREDFAEIAGFISRIEAYDDEDLVTKKESEILLKLGFNSLVYSLDYPRRIVKISKSISIAEEVNDNDLVTNQEDEKLLRLGFNSPVRSLDPHRRSDDAKYSTGTWGQINAWTECDLL